MQLRGHASQCSLDASADVVVQPEVGALGVDKGVVRVELGRRDVVGLSDSVTAVAGLDLVELLAVGDDAGHLRLGPGVGGLGGFAGSCGDGGGRGSRAGGVDADVVVEPEVAAGCFWEGKSGHQWWVSLLRDIS